MVFIQENNNRLQHIDRLQNYKLVTSTEKIHDVYRMDGKIIGSGSFGHIRIGINRQSNLKVAIKTIKKNKL